MKEIKDQLKKGNTLPLTEKFLDHFRTQDMRQTRQALTIRKNVFWSWGANGFVNYANKVLKFKTNGFNHKGHVYILLAANDTYTVVVTNTRRKIISTASDIYGDDLQDMVDIFVEKGCDDKTYKEKVQGATYSF